MFHVEQQRKGRLLVGGIVAMVAVAALFFMRTPSRGPQVTQHVASTNGPVAARVGDLATSEAPGLAPPPANISRSSVGAREMVLRTLDPTLQPLAGVEVFVNTESFVERLGATDSEGLWVGRAPDAPGWFVASKIGYSTVFSRVPADTNLLGSEVVLTLDAECTILGTVRAPDGIAARFPVNVYAWPESIRPSASWFASQGDGAPLRTRVDRDGQFVLRGLVRGERYCVIAAAEGRAADSIGCWDAPAYGVELALSWAYALEVRAVEAGGQHLRTDGELHEYEGTSWRPTRGVENADRLTWNDPRAHLLLRNSSPRESDSSQSIQLIYLRKTGAAVGPFAMTWRVPGYEPKDVEVLVPRMEANAPRIELVHLEPRVACWGSAALHVLGAEGSADSSALSLADLRLTEVESKETYSLSLSRTGKRTVNGVPCGTYRASLLVREWGMIGTTDGLPVTIRSESEARLNFDLSTLGRITVSIERSGGASYEGAVEGYLVRDERIRIPVQFEGAPYVITGLLSGAYGLDVQFPASLAGKAVVVPANLPPGASLDLKILWPD